MSRLFYKLNFALICHIAHVFTSNSISAEAQESSTKLSYPLEQLSTGPPRTWEHEQIVQGNWGTKWILGSSLEFLLREQSRKIFGIKGDFGNFSRDYGNTDPLGPQYYFLTRSLSFNKKCSEDSLPESLLKHLNCTHFLVLRASLILSVL